MTNFAFIRQDPCDDKWFQVRTQNLIIFFGNILNKLMSRLCLFVKNDFLNKILLIINVVINCDLKTLKFLRLKG